MANNLTTYLKRVRLNVNQAADFLEAHPETVRKWIRDGKIPAHRIGRLGNYFLYQDELKQVVESEPLTQLERE